MGTGQICTKTLSHEGTLLHEDIFARKDIFAQRQFCRKGQFCERLENKESYKKEGKLIQKIRNNLPTAGKD